MVIHRIFHIIRLNEVRRAKICAHLIRNQLPIISGNLRLIVCHAKPPVDSTFPSEQILSKKESNGQTRIQKPCEIRFGTKRSQVQILSPRPPKDSDIDTMSESFHFAVFWRLRCEYGLICPKISPIQSLLCKISLASVKASFHPFSHSAQQVALLTPRPPFSQSKNEYP